MEIKEAEIDPHALEREDVVPTLTALCRLLGVKLKRRIVASSTSHETSIVAEYTHGKPNP